MSKARDEFSKCREIIENFNKIFVKNKTKIQYYVSLHTIAELCICICVGGFLTYTHILKCPLMNMCSYEKK
jgi:hypothetical protein